MSPFELKYTEEAVELVHETERILLLLEEHSRDVSLIQQVFRNLHTLKGNSAMLGFRIITDFTHHLETIYDQIRSGKIKVTAEIINITLASLDHLSGLLYGNKQLTDDNQKKHEQLTRDIIAIIDRINNDSDDVTTANELPVSAEEKSRLSEIPFIENGSTIRKQVITGIRVPVERLDNMMSLVTELITLQAKLSLLTTHQQPDLVAAAESLEKISTRLRDNAFSMCLVPIEHMVTPFHRLVRDLAAELNKEIDFITEGTETELDKNIMEGLQDPLMHLLRNSIDHGIETPAEREQNGKPRHGRILFKAYCAGAHVFIEIHDDGKGMDVQKIRAHAINIGLINEHDVLSDKELLNLVFLPGFSTADQVTETSGRGVGMDVVKRRTADIKGQVSLSSVLHMGTTVTIMLPITLSIIDGLLVKVNNADYVIPLASVDTCHELLPGHLRNSFSNLLVIEGEAIPFINLQNELQGTGATVQGREIVIVHYEGKKVGLVVDCIAGKLQAVLKPLGEYYQHLEMVTGATILGNGNIALVLDTNKLMEQFLSTKNIAV